MLHTATRRRRIVLGMIVVGLVSIATPQARHNTAPVCPLSQGYWKNHSSAWTVTSLTLGTVSYSASQVLTILNTPVKGDASLILAHQLIAALLNIAAGADGSAVTATITDANALLGSASIPQAVDPSSVLGKKMTADASILDSYNNGALGGCANTPPPGSCQPSSSLSAMVTGTNVVAYVPKGAWAFGGPGIGAVNIEGSSIANTTIPTGVDTINSCASNPITGQTVCTANSANVYILKGNALDPAVLINPVASSGTQTICFSGGCATNTGVAMDATHNKALIGLSLAGVGGFQFLNLAGVPTFEPAFASMNGGVITEDPLVDPIRNLLLSAAENGTYEVIDISTTTLPAFYENTTFNGGGELDSTAEDCNTGIALAPFEFSIPSVVAIADLTQATFVPGAPGTWSAPSQLQLLTESSLTAGATGMAVAQGTHTAVLSGEFGGDAMTALALPATSGSGTPAIADWMTCSIGNGFINGWDPHSLTSYKSPTTGHAMAIFSNSTFNTIAVVDLTAMLNSVTVPRTVLGHACASGTLPAGVVSFIPY